MTTIVQNQNGTRDGVYGVSVRVWVRVVTEVVEVVMMVGWLRWCVQCVKGKNVAVCACDRGTYDCRRVGIASDVNAEGRAVAATARRQRRRLRRRPNTTGAEPTGTGSLAGGGGGRIPLLPPSPPQPPTTTTTTTTTTTIALLSIWRVRVEQFIKKKKIAFSDGLSDDYGDAVPMAVLRTADGPLK